MIEADTPPPHAFLREEADRERERRSGWKNCNTTPFFCLTSFLFTSQTHQGVKVHILLPETLLQLVELTSYFLFAAHSARLLFSSSVFRLTGLARL